MERKVVIVCSVVGFLGILSAALGFAAEGTRVRASDVETPEPGTCVFPRSPALVLGLLSVLTLMLAQSVINTFAGCICCQRHQVSSDTNWRVALISLIASWCAFIIAFHLLLKGAILNDQRGVESMYFGSFCYVVKPGVFSVGAVLSLASVALAIVYYVALTSSKTPPPTLALQNQGIVMGHPVIPQRSSEPVFVHEDTYNRQQFP